MRVIIRGKPLSEQDRIELMIARHNAPLFIEWSARIAREGKLPLRVSMPDREKPS